MIVLVDFYYCAKPYNLLGGSLPVNLTSNIVKIRTLVIPTVSPYSDKSNSYATARGRYISKTLEIKGADLLCQSLKVLLA